MKNNKLVGNVVFLILSVFILLPFSKLSAKVWVYEARDSNVVERAEIYAKGKDLAKEKSIEYSIIANNYKTGYTAIMEGWANRTAEHVDINDSLDVSHMGRDFCLTTPHKANSIITIKDQYSDLLNWNRFYIDDGNTTVYTSSRFNSLPLKRMEKVRTINTQILHIRDAIVYSNKNNDIIYTIELENFTTMEKDSIGFIVSRKNKKTCFFDMIQGCAKKHPGTIPIEYSMKSDGYITYLYKPTDSCELFIQIESGNKNSARFFSRNCAYCFVSKRITNDRVTKSIEEYYTSGDKLLKRKD
jgi:hypothetical protein